MASLYGQPLESNQLRLYAMALSDLSGQQLEQGFQIALRESKFWPRPAELREFCTGIPAKGTDVQRANRYWAWTTKWAPTLVAPREYSFYSPMFVGEFHPEGIDTHWAYSLSDAYHPDQAYMLAHHSVWDDDPSLTTVTVDIRSAIDPILVEILTQLEGSVSRGLDRVVAHLASGDDMHLRHNFEEAALSVLAAHKADPTYTPPSRQLAGNVGSDDTVVTRRGLFEVHERKLSPIREDKAHQLRSEGTISEKDLESHLWTLANFDTFSRSDYKPPKKSSRKITRWHDKGEDYG
jgi:hypothetical protein